MAHHPGIFSLPSLPSRVHFSERHCSSPSTSGCSSFSVRAYGRSRQWGGFRGRVAQPDRHQVRVSASNEVDSQTSNSSSAGSVESASGTDSRIRRTLGNLDALLGIEEDEKGNPKEKDDGKATDTSHAEVSIAPEVLRQLAAAEAARGALDPAAAKDVKELEKQMARIAETAKRAASSPDEKQNEAMLRSEFENLLQIIRPEGVMDKGDLQLMKDKVFGTQTFFVTETRLTDDMSLEAGWLIRGNLRAKREEVIESVDEGVRKLFGDKYTVLVVEDPDMDPDEAPEMRSKRLAFQIMPSAVVQPSAAPGWQNIAAGVLLLLTLGTSLQLGLVANVSKLPKEIVDWLANPDNLNAESLPPFIENFDAVPYLESALPIAGAVLGINVLHEVVQRSVALSKKIKLGPPLFVPNGQIGSFGAISQLKSLVKNRTDLFDLAFSGPAAAGIVSLILFGVGLSLSGGGLPKEELVPVPTALFQGSLLLGSVCKGVLGASAGSAATLIHPSLIAGWCGLVVTSLNLLPVGSLDGGRMMQAAFGRGGLVATSFFTYVGLGLGFIASSLSLPFGIFVLVCQRQPEKYIQDAVSEPGTFRQRLAAAAFIIALLILLPNAPEASDTLSSTAPGLYL